MVTHAEATHHLDRVVGGWHDSQLTPAGARAAAAAGQALRARIPADAAAEVFSSDLRRAAQTATAVARALNVEPAYDRRLREKSYGEAEGRPQEWLDQRFIPSPAAGERMEHDEGIAGAETKASLARRIYAAMDDILTSGCAHQVIVTHGMAATFVLACWIRMPLESAGYVSFRAAPGSITVLYEDDYFHNRQVVSLGDTRHLPSEPSGRPSR